MSATEKDKLFAERLRKFRTSRKLNQSQMAKILGVSDDYVSQMENLAKLPGEPLRKLFDLVEQSPLHAPGKSTESLSVREVKEEAAERRIPVISCAQAGQATEFEELPFDETDTVPYLGNDEQAFALRVEGDSMEPKFPPGTIIIVSPKHPPTNGNLVVARIRGQGVLFKVFHHSGDGKLVTLTSYNSVYPPMTLNRELFHWIWRIVESRNKH